MKLSKTKELICILVGQIVAYSLICYNIRAVAQADYISTAVSDAIFTTVNFLIIRHIAKSEDSIPILAVYVLGSVIGSMIGIYLSVQHNG
jgi:hypothetical protein